MSRRDARVAAMQMMYRNRLQDIPGDTSVETILDNFDMMSRDNLTIDDLRFAKTIIAGVEEHSEAIDSIISNCLVNWEISRLPIVDLCILRIAAYEILFCDNIPDSVAASEAIDIASKYSTDDATTYINGVLRSIITSKS